MYPDMTSCMYNIFLASHSKPKSSVPGDAQEQPELHFKAVNSEEAASQVRMTLLCLSDQGKTHSQ